MKLKEVIVSDCEEQPRVNEMKQAFCLSGFAGYLHQ